MKAISLAGAAVLLLSVSHATLAQENGEFIDLTKPGNKANIGPFNLGPRCSEGEGNLTSRGVRQRICWFTNKGYYWREFSIDIYHCPRGRPPNYRVVTGYRETDQPCGKAAFNQTVEDAKAFDEDWWKRAKDVAGMDPPEIPNENTSKEIKSVKARPTLPPLEPGSSDNFFGPTAPPFTGFNIGVTFGASTVTSGRGSNTLLFGPGRNLLGVEPVFPENPGGEVLEAVAGGDVAVVRHPPADRIGWTGMGGLSIGYNFAAGPVVIGGQLSVQGSAAGDSLIPLTPVGAFNPAVPNSFAPFNPIVPTGVMQISNGPAFGAGVRVGVPVSLFRYGELGINVPSFSVSPAAPNLFTYVSLGLRIQDVTVTVAPTTLWTEPGQPVGRLTHTSVRPTLGVGMEFQVGAVPDLGSIVVGLEYNHIFGSNSGLSSIPVQVAPGVIAPITMPATPQSGNEVKAGVKLYFDALGRNQVM